MTLQLVDGFESANAGLLRNGMSVPSLASLATRAGADGVGLAIRYNNASGQPLTVPFPVAAATLILQFHVWWETENLWATAQDYCSTVLRGPTGTNHLSINLDVNGRVQLRRGASNATAIATGTTVITRGYHYFKIKATCADSGGICVVEVDGNVEINFNGDTRNGGADTTFGSALLPLGSGGLNSGMSLDNLIVMDGNGAAPFNDFIPEQTIKVLRVLSQGAYAQGVGSDGNSVDNYQLVDENPMSNADFVGLVNAGDKEYYNLTALAGLQSVSVVQPYSLAAKTDAGARSINTGLRSSGGTINDDAGKALSTTWGLVQGNLELVDPDGNPWTPALVNTTQVGVECV